MCICVCLLSHSVTILGFSVLLHISAVHSFVLFGDDIEWMQHNLFTPGFLTLGTVSFGPDNNSCCPLYCQVCSSIPTLKPMDAFVTIENVSRDCQTSPYRAKLLLKTTDLSAHPLIDIQVVSSFQLL